MKIKTFIDSEHGCVSQLTHDSNTTALEIDGQTHFSGSLVVGSKAEILTGAGSPVGSVSAPAGSLYLNISGGVSGTLWVKETGSGSSGWAHK